MSHDRFRYGLIGAAFCVSVLFFIRLPAIVGRHVRIPLLDFARISISFTVVAAALAIVLQNGREATNVVRYALSDSGRTLVAEEAFRAPVLKYDNLWVAEHQR